MTAPPLHKRTSRSRAVRARNAQAARDQTTGTRRVAIYTRRSTDEEHQPFSIDAQRTALHAYARSQPGWAVVAEYSDDASGAKLDRPGLRQAYRAAEAGEFDVLLVYRVDRFSRRLSDMLALMHELDGHGVAFCSATESFDTSTPIGRMLLHLLGVLAVISSSSVARGCDQRGRVEDGVFDAAA